MDDIHYRPEFEQDRIATEIEMPKAVLDRLTLFVCRKASEWLSSEEGRKICKRNRENAKRRERYAAKKKGRP